ncbi:hypothetical protein WJX84_012426 [Apatococcus fuscideae]|uniref:J domain-containing protein n=1 Tax=Apatococcus fuscideae TaxID=2026836 RepID=A0AAW1SRV1_9CHLO
MPATRARHLEDPETQRDLFGVVRGPCKLCSCGQYLKLTRDYTVSPRPPNLVNTAPYLQAQPLHPDNDVSIMNCNRCGCPPDAHAISIANNERELGNDAYAAGQHWTAIQHYTRGLADSPHDALLYSNRAAAYLATRWFLQALHDAEHALSLRPDWAKAWGRKAAALAGLQRWADTVKACKECRRLDPTSPACARLLKDAQMDLKAHTLPPMNIGDSSSSSQQNSALEENYGAPASNAVHYGSVGMADSSCADASRSSVPSDLGHDHGEVQCHIWQLEQQKVKMQEALAILSAKIAGARVMMEQDTSPKASPCSVLEEVQVEQHGSEVLAAKAQMHPPGPAMAARKCLRPGSTHSGLGVAALSGLIQGCRPPEQTHDVLGVLRGRCRECGPHRCPVYKPAAGLSESLLLRRCAACGCDSTSHESPEDTADRVASELRQKQAAAEKAQRLLDAVHAKVRARQQRVKAAEERLAKAEEEGDFIQTTNCDGLSQNKRGSCTACTCNQFTITYRTCDANDPNVMLFCAACGCEAAAHSIDEAWQQAQDLQKQREAEATAQRAERARQTAATAASRKTVEEQALAELGLKRLASPTSIRAAYKRLALLHHPDKHQGPHAEAARDRFVLITAAYQTLKSQ